MTIENIKNQIIQELKLFFIFNCKVTFSDYIDFPYLKLSNRMYLKYVECIDNESFECVGTDSMGLKKTLWPLEQLTVEECIQFLKFVDTVTDHITRKIIK